MKAALQQMVLGSVEHSDAQALYVRGLFTKHMKILRHVKQAWQVPRTRLRNGGCGD